MNYCTGCGAEIDFNKYQKAFMMIKGDLVYRCPRCQTEIRFRLIEHVVKMESGVIDKTEIWKRC